MVMYSPCDDHCWPGFPIRKFTDQNLLAVPRDLSQRATSFIASYRQGIHLMLLLTLDLSLYRKAGPPDHARNTCSRHIIDRLGAAR